MKIYIKDNHSDEEDNVENVVAQQIDIDQEPESQKVEVSEKKEPEIVVVPEVEVK